MKNKLITLIIAAALICSISSCTIDQATDSTMDMINSYQTSESEEVLKIKNSYLTAYSSDITIGQAFENFLAVPIWQYFKSDTGQKVVEFNGQCTYNEKTIEATVQFILNDDDTFELHTVAFNDIEQNPLMAAAFIEKIYDESNNLIQNNSVSQDDNTSQNDTFNYDDNAVAYTALTDSQVKEIYGYSKADLAKIAANSYFAEYSTIFNLNDVFSDWFSEIEWVCTTVYEHRYEVECRGKCYYKGELVDVVISVNMYPDINESYNESLVSLIYINGVSQSVDATDEFLSYAYGQLGDIEEYFWDHMIIPQEDLNEATKDDINFYINQLYAKHGYIFSNPEYRKHFEEQRWYKPQYTDQSLCEAEFNDYERENLKIMTSYAKSKGWR